MNAFTFNTIIAGCARHGMMREARHFFDTMQRMDVLPNHFSFNSLIAACTRAGAIDEAFLVIDTPHLHAANELLEQPEQRTQNSCTASERVTECLSEQV